MLNLLINSAAKLPLSAIVTKSLVLKCLNLFLKNAKASCQFLTTRQCASIVLFKGTDCSNLFPGGVKDVK
jgi:hypothetical protein